MLVSALYKRYRVVLKKASFLAKGEVIVLGDVGFCIVQEIQGGPKLLQ